MVIGLLLIYEVLIVFFLEVSFFGVMMFGWGWVLLCLYFLFICMVVLGMLFFMFWILLFNSWLYILVGYEMVNGIVYLVDWW